MIFLKVHNSGSTESHRISDFPCKIGRALGNDVVIDHPSVSSHHAVIDRNESGFYIQDLGSTNGIVYDSKLQRHVALAKTLKLQLGEVSIGIRVAEEILEKTAIRNFADLKVNPKPALHPALVTVAAFAAALFISFTIEKFLEPNFKASTFAKKEITAFFFFLIGGAALGIWAKFQTQRFSLMKIVFVLIVFLTMFRIIITIADFVDFNLDTKWLSTTWEILSLVGICHYSMNELGKIIFSKAQKLKRHAVIFGILLSISGLLFGVEKILEEERKLLQIPIAIGYPLRSFSIEKHSFEKLEGKISSLGEEIEKQRLELEKKIAGM